MIRLRRRDAARSVNAMPKPEACLRRLLSPVLLGLLLAGHAAARPTPSPEAENRLDPIVVEGQRDPLDTIGVHRERLPCIGDCEAAEGEPGGLSRFWRSLVELSIYGPPAQKPEPVQSLGVVNPIKARLDDKQP